MNESCSTSKADLQRVTSKALYRTVLTCVITNIIIVSLWTTLDTLIIQYEISVRATAFLSVGVVFVSTATLVLITVTIFIIS